MNATPSGATIPGITHHRVEGERDHAALRGGGNRRNPDTPGPRVPRVLVVVHKLIPLLAVDHRVFAVDLRGFGDSGNGPGTYDSATVVRGSAPTDRAARRRPCPSHRAGHRRGERVPTRDHAPRDVLSLTAIETGLPGFGNGSAGRHHSRRHLVHRGSRRTRHPRDAADRPRTRVPGTVHISGPERYPGAITETDIDEFARTYARPDGWRGATGLYQSMLREGSEITTLAQTPGLNVPVLAVGARAGSFTLTTMTRAAASDVSSASSTASATTPPWKHPKS